MKVLFAPDSFKGSLSAAEAAQAMASGWKRVFPDAQTLLLPVADGGEGTRAALIEATGGRNVSCTVTGPRGAAVEAAWGLLGDGRTAVVELADAAGLTLLTAEQRDPKVTTTYGVGELFRNAVSFPGVNRVIVGLGGSATNDAGAGLLAALGMRFWDGEGQELALGGAALSHLARVDRTGLFVEPDAVEVLIACDVDNPLTGPRGASAIFGPQKGATPADVALLDAALERFATVMAFDATTPGSGAAGGTAAGLLTLFPKARLAPGIDLVLDALHFETHLSHASLVVTGEGRLDGQTLGGKVVAGVGRRARDRQVPALAIVGSLTGDVSRTALREQAGMTAVLPATPRPCTLDEAMHNAALWLADAAERAASLVSLGAMYR
jgi:glycerate kinase